MSDWLAATFAHHRPRALAALTRYFRDVEIAEDAFSEACVKALTEWAETGQPRDPLAWLLTVARRAGLDRLRKTHRQNRLLAENQGIMDPPDTELPDPDALRDDVLRLLFICCHPALERRDQIALALRIVGGLSVAEIARGFLVKPKTMEQRLTRARRKIGANPVPFETPSLPERAQRLTEVSLMVYLMFNEGWASSDSAHHIRHPICEEAIRLARLLAELFPGMAEPSALLSLLLFQYARRDARQDETGRLVPFEAQDRARWHRGEIAEARVFLQKAQRLGQHGPYAIQAEIAAEHARAGGHDDVDWPLIEALYAALFAVQPSPVIRLNLIAVQARTRGPHMALDQMQDLAAELDSYRWFHTMRGALLMETGQVDAARAAYARALELGPSAQEQTAIREKLAQCEKN